MRLKLNRCEGLQVKIEALTEAVKEALEAGKRNFTQSIDLTVNLRDIDPKKPEARLNELVEVPHAVQKEVKVCTIASGQLALEAKKAGAERVLQREDLENLAKDRKAARRVAQEYDFFLSEASMMPLVGKIFGPFLGPKGKMPTPIPPNAPVHSYIERLRRTVRLRLKDQPIVHCRVGVEGMDPFHIAENAMAVLRRLEEKLEKGAKSIAKVYVKTTMGKPVVVKGGS